MTLHLRSLAGGTARVEHDLGVPAGVDHKADNPFGVSEHGSAQQCLAKVDRVFVIGHDHGGREPVHVVVGLLAVYMEGVLGTRAVLSVAEMRQRRASTSGFEVCLSVQVFRLHESHVVFLGGCTDNKICGDWLIVVNLDEIANFDVFPSSLAPSGVVLVMPPLEKVMVVAVFVSFNAIRGIVVFESVVIRLLRVLMITDRLRRGTASLHFYIPGFHNMRLLLERARNEPPNERLALLPGDIVVDKLSALQYPNDG